LARRLIGAKFFIMIFHWLSLIVLSIAVSAVPARAEPTALSDTNIQAISAMTPLTAAAVPSIKGKPIVVSFFASWCPPCTDEFRQLNRLRARFPEPDLTILALNIFEGHFEKNRAHRMKRFLNRTAPTFPILAGMDDDALSALFGGVERIPSVYVFDKHGKPAFSFIHALNATKRHATFEELEKAVAPLVAAP